MIPDNGKHLILEKSFGNHCAYPCSISAAAALLETVLEDIPPEVTRLAAPDSDQRCLPMESIERALFSLTQAKPGDNIPEMRRWVYGGAGKGEDERPLYVVTQPQLADLALWCMQQGLRPQDLKHMTLTAMQDAMRTLPAWLVRDITTRAKGAPVEIHYAQTLDMAHTYRILQAGKWLETAREFAIVNRYLEFINLLSHRDVKYEVIELRSEL